ncbi:hypothetical protein BV372_08095 [Nostoc sp. T09]|nr:hypothetical protein [Nostoc sp. T09]OUL36368.1 hypothetical protein BV372_08095 [Nostoc sp. T09]
MQSKNGRTKYWGEKDCKRDPEDDISGLGSFTNQGGTAGHEPNQVFDPDSSWRDPLGERNSIGGQTTPGGILSRLKNLHKAYVSYVDADRQILEARLNENKLHRQNIVAEIEQLETLLLKALGETQEYQE